MTHQDSQPLLLNLATWLPRTSANGPGSRMTVWVQGCPFRCKSCQNPDFLEYKPNKIVTVDQVWQAFQRVAGISGISFSGGEPFAQAIGLAELASRVRDAGKTVVCWSGYRLDQLQSEKIPGASRLLSYVDLLIDGQFVEPLSGEFSLRGSQNQKLHFLSGRIKEEDLQDIPRQEWIIGKESLTRTGFPE